MSGNIFNSKGIHVGVDARRAQGRSQRLLLLLNRKTGALISAQPFVMVNWAKEIDLKTGRPVELAVRFH